MNKLFYISLFFFFSAQKVINALKCNESLVLAPLKDLSVSSILGAHEDKDALGKWLYFFFSHFNNTEDVTKYGKGLNLHSLDVGDRDCFSRAVTVFLLHCEANKLRTMSRSRLDLQSYFSNLLHDARHVTKDFFDNIGNRRLLELLDTIIVDEEQFSRLDGSFTSFQKLIEVDKKGLNPKLNPEKLEKYFFGHPDQFEALYLANGGSRTDVVVTLAIRDFHLLTYLSTKPNYYNSDVSQYTVPNPSLKEKKRRYLLLKRSSTFTLNTAGFSNELLKSFNPCYHDKNAKGDFGTVFDLVYAYTTITQQKLILGHKRFLQEFNESVITKSHKIRNVKGLRYLQQLFRRKNLSNVLKLYYSLIGRELSFITEDFLKQFDSTYKCQVEIRPYQAGRNYYALKTLKG